MASLADLLRSQNFGKNDSAILSTINHPITAARRGLNVFRNNVNTVAGLTEQYDNPNPLAGYTPEQQAEAALNLAGLMQTGGMPFAPSGAGTLGSIKNLNANLLSKYLKEGKLSPEEMAQYEINALAMETPSLQKYNLENANLQGGTPESRAKAIGYDIDSSTDPDIYETALKNQNIKGFPTQLKSNLLEFTKYLEDKGINYKYTPSKSTNSAYLTLNADPYTTYLGKPAISDVELRFSDHSKNIKKQFSKPSPSDEFLVDIFENGGHSLQDAKNLLGNTPGLRSRFAAFDPLRTNSSSLLASTAGAFTLADLLSENRNK
jgi:hypothetical protein